MFFYADVEPPRNPNQPFILKPETPNRLYAEHYSNSLMLAFFLQHWTALEKMQASKELIVCERKMKYWQHHSDFSDKKADADRAEIKSNWRVA
jgi:hypothetical protein